MGNVQFLQIEFNGVAGTRYSVADGWAIPFDTTVFQSKSDGIETDIDFDAFDDVAGTGSGMVTFTQPGVFFINWFVAQQTGLSAAGSNFSLILTVDGIETQSVIGSANTKISSSSGFAVLTVPKSGSTLILRNISGSKATLSEHTLVKAGMAIFSLGGGQDEVLPLGFGHYQTNPNGFGENNNNQLATGESIPFSNTIKEDANGVVTFQASYSANSINYENAFILKSTGTYHINWEIPVSATDIHDETYTQLIFNNEPYSTAYIPTPLGVVVGSAIIANNTANGIVQLKCFHTDIVGDTVIVGSNANMVITQISHSLQNVSTE